MVFRRCCPFFVTIVVAATASADEMRVERQTLVDGGNTLVVQLHIEVPRSDGAEMTQLDFRWHGEVSSTIRNGMSDQSQEIRRATIVVVAQVTRATDKHPAMLMVTTQQKSGGKAKTFQAHKLDSDMDMSGLLTIDVESGTYDLVRSLQIGTMGGQPITLSVLPFSDKEAG